MFKFIAVVSVVVLSVDTTAAAPTQSPTPAPTPAPTAAPTPAPTPVSPAWSSEKGCCRELDAQGRFLNHHASVLKTVINIDAETDDSAQEQCKKMCEDNALEAAGSGVGCGAFELTSKRFKRVGPRKTFLTWADVQPNPPAKPWVARKWVCELHIGNRINAAVRNTRACRRATCFTDTNSENHGALVDADPTPA